MNAQKLNFINTKIEFYYSNNIDKLDLVIQTFKKNSFDRDNEERNNSFDRNTFGEKKN